MNVMLNEWMNEFNGMQFEKLLHGPIWSFAKYLAFGQIFTYIYKTFPMLLFIEILFFYFYLYNKSLNIYLLLILNQ